MSEQSSKPSIPILFEDNHLLVVVKPANIPTQADDSQDSDLLNQLKEYIRVKYKKPGAVYLGLIHRLDRPTGGVMVFARTSKAAARLSEQLRIHTVEKQYLAVVAGILETKTAELTHYLTKDNQTNTVAVSDNEVEGALKATLDYRLLQMQGGLSLLEIKLLTGRPHQIRAQMSHIGHPVVGDTKYGGVGRGATSALALWAYKLEFDHPVTKERLKFKVLPPKDQYPWDLFNLDSL